MMPATALLLLRLLAHSLAGLSLAVLPLAATPAAAAKALRLNEFAALCQKGEGDACRAYVVGVADGSRVINAAIKGERLFCMPEQVTEQQLVAAVVDMAREDVRKYPPDDALLAASYIGAALLNAYPCK